MFEIFFKRIRFPVSSTLLFIAVIYCICDYNYSWKKERWKALVHTDAAHYYRYLPAIFIDHKLDDPVENPKVIKCYIGTPLFYAPFFGVAVGLSAGFDFPVDGYSFFFPVLISIGTLFYLLLGLHFFGKFLRFYFADPWVISLSLFALAFGTIAFYYTVNSPGWAHIVAFSLVSFILYHMKKLTVDYNRSGIMAIIIGSSCLFFTRPTDLTILVIAPFLTENFKSFLEILRKIGREKRTLFFSLLIAAIPGIFQISIYKAVTGKFIVWSYSKEGFNFLHPEIINVLFSYTKGLFVYTPVCFLALFGLLRLYKLNFYLFTGVVLYLGLNIYIISSWWSWNYGYCYGARAFVDHYPLFFFLLALLLDSKSRMIKGVTFFLIMLLCPLNLFQIYQAANGLIENDIRTDAKGYWHVFLRTDRGFSGKYFRFPLDERPANVIKRTVWFNDMEKKDTTQPNSSTLTTEKAHSGGFSSKVDHLHPYSISIQKKLTEVPYHKNVFIRSSGWFHVTGRRSYSVLLINFTVNGEVINSSRFRLDDYLEQYNTWEHQVFEIYMPKLDQKFPVKDVLMELVYLNHSNIPCYVDDLKIEFIEFKKMDRILDISWE